MKVGNKRNSPKIEEAVSRAVDYEVAISDIARRSERRAWFVAFSAVLMALILAAGYFLMLPLKEKVPYLVMADAYAGTSTVARLRKDSATDSITTSEAVNRSNVSHYILARESYDWSLIGNRDWNTVFAMSSQGIAGSYKQLFDRNSADNLTAIYGKSKAIRVKILSLQLFGREVGAAPKSAVVRFQRFVYDKLNGSSVLLDNKIVTIEFTYKPYLEMDEEYGIENPLGFWVTNYRVDDDVAMPPIDAAPRNASTSVAGALATDAPAVPAIGTEVTSPGAPGPVPTISTPVSASPSNANGAIQR